MARAWSAAALTVIALLSGCAAQARNFIWAEQVPRALATLPEGEYRIEQGDVITVRVWQQDTMSVDRARVRADGKISLPFLQDVDAEGMTPGELSLRVQVKLRPYVVNPVVTVTVVEQRPVRVSIVGEVARIGAYELDRGAGVVQAIAAAGGLTEYAHRDRIYVLRQGYWADGNPAPARIRFRYDALASGEGGESAFQLRPGDVIVVE